MRKLISVFIVAIFLLVLTSCGSSNDRGKKANIYVLTGPTGVGIVNMWDKNDSDELDIKYNFNTANSPDEVVAKISNGEVDIAAIPTNIAAKLYKKSDKNIKILAVNTLGVLSVLDNSNSQISSLSDLKNKKIVTTGQNANPQYIIQYLLEKNDIDINNDVQIEYKTDNTDLAAVWASEPNDILIAPSPISASILSKYNNSKKVLDLTDEWEKCSNDSELMMGCVVARSDFCNNHSDIIESFMNDYEESINSAKNNVDNTSILCEKYGIVANSSIAKKAIPDCHTCFIIGDQMKTNLTGYFNVLYEINPSSIDEVPDNDFWY